MKTGYIYEIKSMDTSITEIYIGSTWDMKDRLKCHKHDYNNNKRNNYSAPHYKFIRENGGWINFEMKVIDSGECEDELELHCAEQFYIDMAGGIENLLNSQDAFLLPEEARKRKNIASNKKKHRNKDTKRFYCKTCDYAAQSQIDLDIHYTTNKHKKTF